MVILVQIFRQSVLEIMHSKIPVSGMTKRELYIDAQSLLCHLHTPHEVSLRDRLLVLVTKLVGHSPPKCMDDVCFCNCFITDVLSAS